MINYEARMLLRLGVSDTDTYDYT